MSSLIVVTVLGVLTIGLCTLSVLWVWRSLSTVQDKADSEIDQLRKDIESEISAIGEAELVQTNAGREILAYRMTDSIDSEYAKGFVLAHIQPHLSSPIWDHLSPTISLRLIKGMTEEIASIAPISKPPSKDEILREVSKQVTAKLLRDRITELQDASQTEPLEPH